MKVARSLFAAINRVLPAEVAYAHCDIPCGIYDPIQAKIASQTVQKMVLRIQALQEGDDHVAYANTMSRYIAVKEQHADLCKKELDILWHDYFNPTHLEKYPDIHTKFWQANKLAARNKQNVDMAAAQELVGTVDEIATIFWATKNVDYKDEVAQVRFGT
jgi:nickel superoxide dismutase